jgi:signal transduction histidine kinase
MLKREIGENEKIVRMEQAVQNILSLQENLKSYLFNYEQEKENLDIKKLVHERVSLIYKNYEDITFNINIENLHIKINRSAFTRVFDNILTNAAKYNKKNGKITVIYDEKKKFLSVIDTGKGIKNPSKIFDRFYKEQERGIGIGLHIVKKLCDELKIGIEVKSELDVGTNFSLLLTKY